MADIRKEITKEKGYYLLNNIDYIWSGNYDLSNGASPVQMDIPKLRVHAYQPIRTAYADVLMPLGAANALLDTAGAIGGLAGQKVAGKVANSAYQEALAKENIRRTKSRGNPMSRKEEEAFRNNFNKGILSSAVNFVTSLPGVSAGLTTGKDLTMLGAEAALQQKLLQNASGGIEEGIKYLQALFTNGEWLASYELPFISNYLRKADGTTGWSVGGIETVGETGAKLGKFLSEGFNVNIPVQPTWNKPAKEEGEEIKTSFYLINNSKEDYNRNYQFWTSLIAHCYWVQISYYMQSPNIFRVECPGRFDLMWATLMMDVEVVGKMRSYGGENLVPDAYKLNLTFKGLCPNNYNLFLNFYRKNVGNDSSTLSTSFDSIQGTVQKAGEGRFDRMKTLGAAANDLAAGMATGAAGAVVGQFTGYNIQK